MAWFERLGAVGYTPSPVLLWAPAGRGQWLTAAADGAVGGGAGADAGRGGGLRRGDRDRRPLGDQPGDGRRSAGLEPRASAGDLGAAHGAADRLRLRRAAGRLALVPPLALRLPVKKIAAAGALVAAAVYLALSGGNVATQRAFVMVAVMLAAVLVDRRALTLRSVAMAALHRAGLQPEA